MIALRSLFGLLGSNRGFLTLLTVAMVAAWLWASYASTKATLTATVAMSERICAAVGSAYQSAKGKPGEACAREVTQLARFKSESQDKTSEALLAAMSAREAKQARDTAKRQAQLDARLAALSTMHTAEEQVHDDQVTGSWFAALNHLAGLRAPGGCPCTHGDCGRDPRHAACRVARLPGAPGWLPAGQRRDPAQTRARGRDAARPELR